MSALSRRSALALGLVAVAGTVVKPAASQTMDMTAGKDTTLAPGVVISAAVAVTTSCGQGLASDSEAEGACPTLGVLYPRRWMGE